MSRKSFLFSCLCAMYRTLLIAMWWRILRIQHFRRSEIRAAQSFGVACSRPTLKMRCLSSLFIFFSFLVHARVDCSQALEAGQMRRSVGSTKIPSAAPCLLIAQFAPLSLISAVLLFEWLHNLMLLPFFL